MKTAAQAWVEYCKTIHPTDTSARYAMANNPILYVVFCQAYHMGRESKE